MGRKHPVFGPLDYARQRMGYGRCDLQVLDANWNVVETITNEDLKPAVLLAGQWGYCRAVTPFNHASGMGIAS